MRGLATATDTALVLPLAQAAATLVAPASSLEALRSRAADTQQSEGGLHPTHTHTAQTPINPKEAYILRVHCEDGVEDVGASPPPEMPANKKKPDAVSTHHVHLHSICLWLMFCICLSSYVLSANKQKPDAVSTQAAIPHVVVTLWTQTKFPVSERDSSVLRFGNCLKGGQQ